MGVVWEMPIARENGKPVAQHGSRVSHPRIDERTMDVSRENHV